MKLKEIHRTSTFAWSPTPSLPLLATGTVAGALDESFSNESQLEIWAPDFLDKHEYDLGGEGQHGAKGSIKDNARFHRLAWGNIDGSRPHGVIAAGMENGELALWDAAKILSQTDAAESLILRNTTHTGPIRGLDFNPLQRNLLSSGAVKGEVYIWDLKDPTKPYSPTAGKPSTKLDEITSVKWNQQVQYVLAGASSTGYTVVWDLRGKREVVALAYGGGAGTLAGQAGAGMGIGGRRGMSDIAWHPDNATRLVTASEDDSSPIIMVWDLRNARAPEKILTGHEKGVLSLSWCKQDADLLLSCGKDNRALCWNPQTSEIIGELPSADNWAFQVDWCPRNPDLLATAFFDGTVGIHSIQSTNEPTPNVHTPAQPDGADIFDVPGFSRSSQGTLSLKQPPKWLRRPTSNSWGFGGNLVSVSNLPSVQGKNQSSVIHLRKVVTEQDLVERARKLQKAIDGQTLNEFTEEKSGEADSTAREGAASWKALLTLFRSDSKDELVTLLGFSKEEIAARVAEAVSNLRIAADASTIKSGSDGDMNDSKPHEHVVSFAEPERSGSSDGEQEEITTGSGVEKTPSEFSASATSDTTSANRLVDGESTTTTAPSLFGDDNVLGGGQDANADFFSTIGISQSGGDTRQVVIPHHNYGLDSSVAATIGSGPSSVASDSLKSNAFKIHPSDESETDCLVTKALVLGDFESAVSLCLCSDRYADAILLAVKGGPELLQRTQKAYFGRRTTLQPYLRLFQSIVTNDLADIVQNADLREWQEIFVVLCTFASQEEFPGLAEQLGRRLEYKSTFINDSDDVDESANAHEYKKNATLTYLAAGRLERLVNIWIDELAEEEKRLVADNEHLDGSRYTAHAHALQTFIEKVSVFRSAIKYVDADLTLQKTSEDNGVNDYKLSALYDRYFEYAGLLAAQGLVKEAVAFFKLAPADYTGCGLDFGRDRLVAASSVTPKISPSVPAAVSGAASGVTNAAGYTLRSYASQVPAAAPAPAPSSTYAPYNSTGTSTVQSTTTQYGPSHSTTSHVPSAYSSSAPTSYPSNSYAPSLTVPPHLQHQAPSQSTIPQAPPPKRRENGGWNDPPPALDRKEAGASNLSKPAAITSPFPNVMPSSGPAPPSSPYLASGQPQPQAPPPPRPGSVPGRVPPPPQASRMHPPPGPGSHFPPHAMPPSGLPGPPQNVAAPARLMSPPGSQGPPRQPTPGQYASPPSRGPMPGRTPPPSQYARPTPPPGPPHGHAPPPPLGRGSPAPGQYNRATPPPMQHQHQQGQYASPPQQPGQYGPPPGVSRPAPPTQAVHPPPGGPGGPPPGVSGAAPPPPQKGPPPPKYPPGDRSHIPDSARPAFNIISEQLNRLKQTTPPQQKRLVDDLERRISPLFDALNCETLSKPVVEQLLVLTRAIEVRDREAALSIHVDLLTRGSQTDDIALWMSGVKQLIMRL